ncbi:EAL domain-containing protein [Thalassotalea eurytherma]|uniref:EAL domain-containing protein n=1 Tax=Thalassotalea eurytherma TaxID=1144278 RepID=A0ABQ6H281_9GAMM|nr:EAL domain-containing protein [Thalassotalea eurytherma]GLX80875.1 hypothetical protein theurythT_03270 [Thalassotalea eurytherma]
MFSNKGSHYTAGDFAQRNLLRCEPNTPIYKAARSILDNQCSSILVEKDNQIVGIWTEADSTLITHQQLLGTEIQYYMSSPVVSVESHTTIEELIIKFYQYKVRHLLVCENGQPTGIVSQSDVIKKRGIEHLLSSRQVKESYQRQRPITLSSAITFESICQHMRKSRATSVLIENKQTNEVGIITERDLVRILAATQPVVDVWLYTSHPLVKLSDSCTLLDAFHMFKENSVRHVVITDDENNVLGVLSFKDIFAGIEYAHFNELQSTIARRELALKDSQKSLVLAERIISASVDGVMIANQSNEIISVNPAFSKITGYAASEVVGQKTSLLSSGMHPKSFYHSMWLDINEFGQWQGEIWNKRKNDEIYPEWLTIIRIGEVSEDDMHYAAIFSDITERKKGEEQIHELAYYDDLTKLPNRSLFNDHLSSALKEADGKLVAVLFIDLDRFKQINDTLGHKAGDELLVMAAKRISSSVKHSDIVSRMGGDEFVVLVPAVTHIDHVEHVMGQIVTALSKPFLLSGRELIVTCSIGASISSESGSCGDTMLKHADIAMYEAKSQGRNTYQSFKKEMNHAAAQKLALENHLRAALVNDEFTINYQLQYDNKNNCYKGLEALIRWKNPILGNVSPAEFIPVAEDIGLIVDIERWVFNKACLQRRIWLEQGVACGKLSVNVSAKHFSKNLFQSITDALSISGLPAKYLEIEITESCFITRFDFVSDVMKQLTDIGITISLDDFGTGYSSLSYLSQLPINAIKIDASFVANIPGKERDCRLVTGIISMAQSLGLDIVAEGVEDIEQEQFLKDNGCHVIQGYLYSKPCRDICTQLAR